MFFLFGFFGATFSASSFGHVERPDCGLSQPVLRTEIEAHLMAELEREKIDPPVAAKISQFFSSTIPRVAPGLTRTELMAIQVVRHRRKGRRGECNAVGLLFPFRLRVADVLADVDREDQRILVAVARLVGSVEHFEKLHPSGLSEERLASIRGWRDEIVALDLSDGNLLKRAAMSITDRQEHESDLRPNTFVPASYSPRLVQEVSEYEKRVDAEKAAAVRVAHEETQKRRAEELAQKKTERAEADRIQKALKAEEAAKFKADRALEKAEKERQAWETNRVQLEHLFSAHLEQLGLLATRGIRDALDQARPWFSLARGEPLPIEEISNLLKQIAPISAHCGGEGPAAPLIDLIGADLKQLVSRHEVAGLRDLKRQWHDTEVEARNQNQTRAEEKRRALEAESARLSGQNLSPELHYLAWQDARGRRFAHEPSDGYFARIDDLLERKVISVPLKEHWLDAARRQGVFLEGGWYAEVFLVERLGLKNKLSVQGFEADSARATGIHRVPDLLVTDGHWKAFVESKSAQGDYHGDTVPTGILTAIQNAEPEFESGEKQVPDAHRVLWISLNVRSQVDRPFSEHLEADIRRALPDPAKSKSQVIVVEIAQERGSRFLFQALVNTGTAWVVYDGTTGRHPFLDRVWDANERAHHD